MLFVQQFRTHTSEVWIAQVSRDSGEHIAQVDIHYGRANVLVTVSFLRAPTSNDEVFSFLDAVDDELISIADDDRGNITWRAIVKGKLVELAKNDNSVADDLLGGL